jgi:hypothetical protein
VRKAEKIFIIYLFTLLFITCGNKAVKDNNNLFSPITLTNEEENKNDVEVENVKEDWEEDCNINNSSIIFSTPNLSSTDLLTAEEIKQKTSYVGHSDNSFIVLPSFEDKEIIIVLLEGGDFEMYYLCIIDEVGFIKIDRSNLKNLNISPYWAQPDNEENFYTKKYFEIYEDYTIRIDTEEAIDGVQAASLNTIELVIQANFMK